MKPSASQFSSSLFYDTVNAYYRTAAVKAAIELDLFSIVGQGGASPTEIAERAEAAPRGIRVLCHYLVAIGFMCADAGRFYLTREMAMYLDRKSPGYLGGTTRFLLSPYVMDAFRDLTSVVRSGTLNLKNDGIVAPDHPQWVEFARAMAPMMALPSYLMAELVDNTPGKPLKVLDVAAGHGLFGIAIGRRNPHSHVTLLDWGNVLEVARENAEAAGLGSRVAYLPGDAFNVEFGSGYDVILMTNFLHHFDTAGCEVILRKARAALNDGGRVLVFEIVANDDRVSPPIAATFSMMMLGTTPAGEVYTHGDLEQMALRAGFAHVALRDIPPAVEKVVVAFKSSPQA